MYELGRAPSAPAGHLSQTLVAFVLGSVCGGMAYADATLEAYYRGDIMSNTDGGLKTGTDYLDEAGLAFEADVGALFGGGDALIFGYLLYNNNETFSDTYPGDLQGVSNIDAPRGIRIYELFYEQALAENVSMRVGLYDLNSEFDAIETGGLFMNSSHGIGADYAQSGENGPSIFPVTSLSARFDWRINDAALLRYAILDGVPGDPDDIGKTTIKLSKDDGALNALEFNYQLSGGTRFVIGGWLYTADFDLIEGQDQNGDPLQDDGNAGLYGFVESPIAIGGDDVAVNAFLRYSEAASKINQIDGYIGAGIVAEGLIRSRPHDQLGLSVASARVSSALKRQVESDGGSINRREMSIELTYSMRLNDWLRIQPDIQYVINPGADPDFKNALVIALQFEIDAGRSWE